jgi:hypothetical protein
MMILLKDKGLLRKIVVMVVAERIYGCRVYKVTIDAALVKDDSGVESQDELRDESQDESSRSGEDDSENESQDQSQDDSQDDWEDQLQNQWKTELEAVGRTAKRKHFMS